MIRLQRTGKKHDPSFRIVLTDSRKGPQSGGFLEILGNYNAQKGEPQFKGDRIKHWISKGAQISDTVHNLLLRAKIIEGEKKDVLHHTRIKKAREKKKPSAQGEVEKEPAKEEAKAEESAQSEVKTEEPAKEEDKAEGVDSSK